ncbi:MAG: PolC-type DNA polymerase III [Clostridia bacterium]|nr:PolC-type DNA polymerase III [Clostridia bacterium]
MELHSVFDKVLSKTLISSLPNGEVKRCDVNMEARTINLDICFDEYVSYTLIANMQREIVAALKLNGITVTHSFFNLSPTSLACKEMAEELRFKNPMVNGFLNDAEYNLMGDALNIELKNGGLSSLKASGFERQYNELCKNRFGKGLQINFSGKTENLEPFVPPVVEHTTFTPSAPKSVAHPANEPIFTKVRTDAPPENGLMVYLDSPKLFYGRLPENSKPMRMLDIAPEEQSLYVWGEVSDYSAELTKRGDKYRVSFSLSDHTNSLNVKMLMDKDRISRISSVVDGNFLLLAGEYAYDDWEKDFVINKVKGMAVIDRYDITDTAEEKRVELHCHTNMSTKDAVASAGDIIKRAHKWGHKAVAITDHGVVQSYPAAAEAVGKIRKGGDDFKVIYGVEAYFVDDTKGEADITKLKSYHQIILVKDLVGLKNLYQLVSKAHVEDFYKRPCTRKSEIEKHREGLIIGSACEAGDLYQAILHGASDEELLEIAKFYDYLEIQPLGNNEFMVRDSVKPDKVNKKGVVTPNPYRHVTSDEVLKDYNRKIVELADKLGLPVVATGDVHFLTPEDALLRKILMAVQGFEDFDNQAPLYLKTTNEMLEDFAYFGERAREFVIDNPNKIADMISDEVIPVPKGSYPPVIEGSDDLLRELCWDRAKKMYEFKGVIPEIVTKRLNKELDSIINNGFSIMYISAQKLVAYSEANGYLVGSRGSVGSSFVATMSGISEVNPLQPHYYCPNCRWSQFFKSSDVGSGFDLPEKNCPECGTPLKRDGHDIPFETFLGFKGDKVPDIDLNFSDEYQSEVQKYTETLFGKENVFKAGTISTIAEKTAFGYVKAYCEEKGITLSQAEMNRLAKKVEGCKIKATSGQHPAGMVIVPRDKVIYDFCPIQHPADDPKSDILTTHFDFHSIHDTILKLDELGHVVPTTYKYLEEYSGVPVVDISMSDPAVYSLFTSTEALGVTPEQIDSKTGTYGLPEFGTQFVRGMLMDCKPKNFSDLLQISGLSHGTDVWLGNAKDLIDSGKCTISEVIGTRDNIMVYLINQGMDEGRAFKITETVRKGLVAKGKVSEDEWNQMEDDMRAVKVPEWYIASCKKIKYMFPKAHAAAYVIAALRLAWYKVYKPIAFYCAYFTARPGDIDILTLLKGKDAVRRLLNEIKAKGREASNKEQAVYENMLIMNEMLQRGLEVLPLDLKKSHAVKYLMEDGKMRPPFGALNGVGDTAAWAIYETAQKGDFLSKEDFRIESGISKTILEQLDSIGVLNGLPDSNQLSLF